MNFQKGCFFTKKRQKIVLNRASYQIKNLVRRDPLVIRYSYNEKAKLWQFLGVAKTYCYGSHLPQPKDQIPCKKFSAASASNPKLIEWYKALSLADRRPIINSKLGSLLKSIIFFQKLCFSKLCINIGFLSEFSDVPFSPPVSWLGLLLTFLTARWLQSSMKRKFRKLRQVFHTEILQSLRLLFIIGC